MHTSRREGSVIRSTLPNTSAHSVSAEKSRTRTRLNVIPSRPIVTLKLARYVSGYQVPQAGQTLDGVEKRSTPVWRDRQRREA